MTLAKLMLILTLCTVITNSYDKIDSYDQIMIFYEEHSFMPILHVYYNRHFSKSKQFQAFIETIEETEYHVGSFAKILLTDCENQKNQKNFACKEIKRLNQNRMIIGYQPNSKFTNFGDKVMQSPPQNRVFDHHSDKYTVEEFLRFINQLVPSFLKQIKNVNQFQDMKKPLYVPKMIFATQQGEIPQVIKQLSVQFFLKFDMGYVDDLTQSVVDMLQLKRFPWLMILKHNFQTGILQTFNYDSQDFSENQYEKIKRFLSSYALKQRRNDKVFHLIKMPVDQQIQTVDSSSSLNELVNKIQSWTFLQQGPTFSKIVELKNKYGLFYNYIHFIKPDVQESKVYMLNPRNDIKIDFDEAKFEYRLLNADDLQSNMTIWLKKDYVIMGVRQQYGYLCTIVDKALFYGLTQCFVIKEESYQQVTKNINMEFKYGFIVSAKQSNESRTKVNGNQIKQLNFEQIYRLLQYTTRMKVKDIIDDFIDHPVKNLPNSGEIQQICNQIFKKCIFYFFQKTNDKTKLEYLELEAKDFVNQYKLYAVDLNCNQHLYQQIPILRQSKGGLIAYHPRIQKYVFLKAKMTRSVIRKFLDINNKEKKALPFKSFTTEYTSLYNCQDQTGINQQKQPSKNQFTEQL